MEEIEGNLILSPANLNPSITLSLKNEWIMEIRGDDGKIIFNREEFPNLTEDDFAEKVIRILEENYKIKFTHKINGSGGD